MRYSKICVVVAAAMTLGACSLDIPPQNQMTRENAFNTEKDLNTTTTSIHASMYYLADCGLPMLLQAGELADELNSGQGVKDWNPKSVLRGSADWKGLYDMIFLSHFLLDNIDKTQGLSTERQNYHRGQAYFALGLAYLSAVQRFGDCPLIENSTRLSAYPLSPQIQVLNKAIEYAAEAYAILPMQGELRDYKKAPLNAKQYATKGAATALLAHLYAWKGAVIDNYRLQGEDAKTAYEQSALYASKLIDGSVGNYALCDSPEDLCQKLSEPTQENREVIYSIVFDVVRNENLGTTPLPTSQYVAYPVNKNATLGDFTFDTEFRVFKSTVDKLYGEEDLRREAYFYKVQEEHEVGGQTYALPYKWRKALYEADNGGEFDEAFRSINADFVYWRLADLYLLRAECYAKIGRMGEAQNDLNTIRRRAEAKPYPQSGETDLRLAIFREREKELFAEGWRYFDVVRSGLWQTELGGRFKTLTAQDVAEGALCLPISESAYRDNGVTVNTQIRLSRYWARYK